MNLTKKTLFFPPLTRRAEYKTKSTGEYYKTYTQYRQEIREDCLGLCVYCDRHENDIGGQEEMELDHFRPKEKYPDLNIPHNLVWSCHKCNNLKREYWPAFGTNQTFVGKEGFIDPFHENRQNYFEILEDGQIRPLKSPAKYMITLLLLDRQGLQRQRQKRIIGLQQFKELCRYIEQIDISLQKGLIPDEQKDVVLQHKTRFEEKLLQLQTITS